MLFLMYNGRVAATASPKGAVRALKTAAEAERTQTPLSSGGENGSALLNYLSAAVDVGQTERCRLEKLIPDAGGLYFSKFPFPIPFARRRGFVRRLIMPLLPVVRRETRRNDKAAASRTLLGEKRKIRLFGISCTLQTDTARVLSVLSMLSGDRAGAFRVRWALKTLLRRGGFLLTLPLNEEKRARLLSRILEAYAEGLPAGGRGNGRARDFSSAYVLFYRELGIDISREHLSWQGFCALLRSFSAGKGEAALPLAEGLERLARGLL